MPTDLTALNLLGSVDAPALVALLFYFLATGRLATGRELREKNKRTEKLEEALSQRDRQLEQLLGKYLPAATSVMRALHEAADDAREGDG